MKHIKTYEENKSRYNIGDIVILNLDKMRRNNIANGYNDNASIIDSVAEIIDDTTDVKGPLFDYEISYYNDESTSIYYDEIEGLASKDEVKRFKLKNDSNKYNL